MTSLSIQDGRFHNSSFANIQTPTTSLIFNLFGECRDVTPTKSLSQNIRVDVNRKVFVKIQKIFFFGGGGGWGVRSGGGVMFGGGGVTGWM